MNEQSQPQQTAPSLADYDYAQPFSFHRWSTARWIEQSAQLIYDGLRDAGALPGHRKLALKHLKAVIVNLYATWCIDPKMYCSYTRDSNAYSKGRYNPNGISRRICDVISALGEGSWIEDHPGFNQPRLKRRSRMRAMQKLIDLLQQEREKEAGAASGAVAPQISEALTFVAREPIELRQYNEAAKRQLPIPYTDTDETRRMRAVLSVYQGLLDRSLIEVRGFPKEGFVDRDTGRRYNVDPSNTFLRRIFNNGDWTQGGRFYGGWWQRLPKDWRKHIYIDRMPTVEIDYSGLHVALLYHLEGIRHPAEPDWDAYALPGYPTDPKMRGLLKTVLLVSLNAPTKASALKAIRSELNMNGSQYDWVRERHVVLEEVIADFATHHAPIAHHLFSGSCLGLQRMDSDIAEHVMHTMTGKEIPILPVHDSFLVGIAHDNGLKDAMREAFATVVSKAIGTVEPLQARMKESGVDRGSWDDFVAVREVLGLKEFDDLFRFTGQGLWYDQPWEEWGDVEPDELDDLASGG